MEMNATVLAAIVAAIAAVVAPVITTWLTNRYHYKIKRVEIFQSQKITAIQRFSSSCSNHLASCNKQTKDEYYKSYGEIFLFASKKHWKDIESLNCDIEQGNFDNAALKLPKVCQALSTDLKL